MSSKCRGLGKVTAMDPRTERTRHHVLACAQELLMEGGVQAVTYSAVARRARVSRNTLYRHWPTLEQLLVDVALRHYRPTGARQPAPAGADLTGFLHAMRDNLRAPGTAAVLTALIAHAVHDATSEEVLQRIAELRRQDLGTVTGPLTDAAFARIVGPLFFQALVARRPLDDGFLDELIAGSQGPEREADREHG